MKGPRLTNTQSRGMRNGTTRYATYTSCLVKEPRGHAIASSERARLMAGDTSFSSHDSAVSPVIAEILFVAITVLLAVLLIAAFSGIVTIPDFEEPVPEILKIVSISHTNSEGDLTWAGIIELRHVGTESLETRAHGLYLYVDGQRTEAVVETLNSYDFIATGHDGVRLLYGEGPKGDLWMPEYFGTLDVSDLTIASESFVTIEVYRKDTGEIVSRSHMYAPKWYFDVIG